jgi:hypothetical protein
MLLASVSARSAECCKVIAVSLATLMMAACSGSMPGTKPLLSAGTPAATPAATPSPTSGQPGPDNPPAQPAAATAPSTPPPPPAACAGAGPVSAQNVTNIDTMGAWETCSSCALAGGQGPEVAHGMGPAGNPSLDGTSAEFNIAGSFPYADAIWWKQLGAKPGATHFVYDLCFYVKDRDAAEALEFDVNQSTDGRKYIFGTQCGINYDHQWAVWDPAGVAWRPTGIPCSFPAYQWNHVRAEFYRANGQVNYVAITLNGDTHNVGRSYSSISSGESEVNVAFQMDQTIEHRPFSAWLDKVSLSWW